MAYQLTPERIAENDAALAAYAQACAEGNDKTIWPTFSRVEQRMSSMNAMGLGLEGERIRIAMNQITRQRREARNAVRQSKAA